MSTELEERLHFEKRDSWLNGFIVGVALAGIVAVAVILI